MESHSVEERKRVMGDQCDQSEKNNQLHRGHGQGILSDGKELSQQTLEEATKRAKQSHQQRTLGRGQTLNGLAR
ncbi:MAG: hypothetical protein OXE77_04850 [Flavobacteriaceae bacterium]|nr:hypothetical protein [Flavobacteriaceae bacterium]MCY4267897.1 hypothetical protein [Flavobacteriaceae bacterium]